MPIPPYDAILNLLPPHLGTPTALADMSPYPCTCHDVCTRFMGTPTRNAILRGFLDLRSQLLQIQINGFQWVSGSFVEDIETQEGRDPNDVDVVTFVSSPADSATLNAKIIATNAQLLDHTYVKATYRVDHFWVPLGTSPQLLVSIARYWYGLFSHRRDRVWKGMLVVELRDSADDQSALALLGVQP